MKPLRSLGWLAGVVGLLVSALGIGARLSGAYWIASFQVGTLLQAGQAALVFGCFCLLVYQTRDH